MTGQQRHAIMIPSFTAVGYHDGMNDTPTITFDFENVEYLEFRIQDVYINLDGVATDIRTNGNHLNIRLTTCSHASISINDNTKPIHDGLGTHMDKPLERFTQYPDIVSITFHGTDTPYNDRRIDVPWDGE